VLRPYRFERELDRSVQQWLGWLPRWEPGTLRRPARICDSCPRYARPLGLDSIPHGPLHALVTSVEALVAEQFVRTGAARFPDLENAQWKVWLDGGAVRVTSRSGQDVDCFLPGSASPADRPEEARGAVTPAQAVLARAELTVLHQELVHAAISRLLAQRQTVLLAVATHVEPVIQRMADELVAEICGD